MKIIISVCCVTSCLLIIIIIITIIFIIIIMSILEIGSSGQCHFFRTRLNDLFSNGVKLVHGLGHCARVL